jgi:ParB-like chromosome segregation protein Spo0J
VQSFFQAFPSFGKGAIHLQIRSLPLKKLKPSPYNPRKKLHPGDPEYEKLKKSIIEFGLVEPLIFNMASGHIIGGHLRIEIMRDLGYTKADVVELDLTDEKEKTLNLALNKISGDWDMTALKGLLQELDTGNIDMELTGFDATEIEELMNQTFQPTNIDDLLNELDTSQAIDKPIWVTVRTSAANQEILERCLAVLEQNHIRVERSYGEAMG